MVCAVATQPAVAQDFVCLHAGEGVLGAGAHVFVGAVVLEFPRAQLAAGRFAVRDDQPGSRVTAVRDRGSPPDQVFGTGLGSRLGVVAVSGHRAADRDDQAGVGVDDHLVVGGVAVVVGLLGHVVVAGGHQRAVNDQHRVAAIASALLESKQRVMWSTIRSAADLETPNSGAIWRSVRLVAL